MVKNNQIKISALILSVAFLNVDAMAENPRLSLGLEGSYYRYTEPKLMQDKGGLYGINSDYFYHFSNNVLLGAEGRIDFGSTDYKSRGTGRVKNIKQFLCEPRALAGYTFRTSLLNLTPFTGFGYRLKRDFSRRKVTTTGHHGYDRTSQYLYLPVGLKLSGSFNKSWDWETTGEFDLLIAGRQHSGLKTTHSKQKGINNKQKKGWGLKGDLLMGYAAGSGKISFGPFVNYWNIKKSNSVPITVNNRNGHFFEPKNNSLEVGVKVKWTF